MADWAGVKAYLTGTYRCEPFEEDGLKMVFDVGGGRSQVIIATWAGGSSAAEAAWLDFHSPIGSFADVNLELATRRTREYVVGGLSSLGSVVTLRNSLPLANLDRNEIEDPLHLLLGIADRLEKDLTGQDAF